MHVAAAPTCMEGQFDIAFLTALGKNISPFGTVVSGYGNNGKDTTEGVVYKNCIGTYLHGPILPKNPCIADFLSTRAILRKTGDKNAAKLKRLNDSIELAAHKVATTRPQ